MGWPQITIISLIVFSLIVGAVLDGEPRTGTHRFSATLISCGLNAWVLWMGGFFG